MEDCAAVFGGAIGGDFPRIPPFPYFNSSIEAPQLAQYFLQDSVNAEAITALLGDSFLVRPISATLTCPTDPFSFHLQCFLTMLLACSRCQKQRRVFSLAARLSMIRRGLECLSALVLSPTK